MIEIEKAIIDTIIGRPICFEAGGNTYEVYPLSLGKFLLVSQIIERIGIDPDNVSASVLKETRDHREDLLRLVAICTLPGADCLYEPYVRKRIKEMEALVDKGLSVLVVSILSMDRSYLISKEAGIDEENQRYENAANRQASNGIQSFGGKTLYGSLIDVACQRYGWTFREVIWGISFASLRLLLADQLRTTYASAGEKKSTSQVINADDPRNRDLVRAVIGGYKF